MTPATEEWMTAARDDLETVAAQDYFRPREHFFAGAQGAPFGRGAEIVDNSRLTHVVAFHAHPRRLSGHFLAPLGMTQSTSIVVEDIPTS